MNEQNCVVCSKRSVGDLLEDKEKGIVILTKKDKLKGGFKTDAQGVQKFYCVQCMIKINNLRKKGLNIRN